MKSSKSPELNRRSFLRETAIVTTSLAGVAGFSHPSVALDVASNEGLHIIGPRKGFSPHIGTLVSMMNWMRWIVLHPVQGLSVDKLDYLHDEKSNRIGAMLLHLAATEAFYQVNTFEHREWNVEEKEKWGAAMELGDQGRDVIKGHPLTYYLEILEQTRNRTIEEFKKRDDDWLMTVDSEWGWGPTNNYCKWFHVCEHESNHNGQIKWLIGRLPADKMK